jgi:hypothetical protein
MVASEPFSEEAEADADWVEAVAYDGPYEGGEATIDPARIESIVGEPATEGAVFLPAAAARGDVHRDDVDGTDAEAVFEEELREADRIEDEIGRRRDETPDVFEVGEKRHG